MSSTQRTLPASWKQGDYPEQIVENFDVLHLADVYAVISYYLHNHAEVEKYLEENRRERERLREENEQGVRQ